jgi:hypothetical protein
MCGATEKPVSIAITTYTIHMSQSQKRCKNEQIHYGKGRDGVHMEVGCEDLWSEDEDSELNTNQHLLPYVILDVLTIDILKNH